MGGSPIAPAHRFNVEMSDAERGQVLQEFLTSVERTFKQRTGMSHTTFGVQVLCYYADWLMLLQPEKTAELFAAIMALHQGHTNQPEFQDAKARLKRARLALAVGKETA